MTTCPLMCGFGGYTTTECGTPPIFPQAHTIHRVSQAHHPRSRARRTCFHAYLNTQSHIYFLIKCKKFAYNVSFIFCHMVRLSIPCAAFILHQWLKYLPFIKASSLMYFSKILNIHALMTMIKVSFTSKTNVGVV